MAVTHSYCWGCWCKVCGGPFVATRSDPDTCGPRCRQKKRRGVIPKNVPGPVHIGHSRDRQRAEEKFSRLRQDLERHTNQLDQNSVTAVYGDASCVTGVSDKEDLAAQNLAAGLDVWWCDRCEEAVMTPIRGEGSVRYCPDCEHNDGVKYPVRPPVARVALPKRPRAARKG